MYLLISFYLIFSELFAEAFKLKGKHIASAIIEWFYRAFVTVIVFAYTTETTIGHWQFNNSDNFWKLIIGFLFVRFAIFDPLYNIMIGEKINYVGFTKLWDKLLRIFFKKIRLAPEHFLFIRFIFFVWGVLWLIYNN